MRNCSIDVTNASASHRTRKCLKSRKYGKFCPLHAGRIFLVKIQALWRGYRIRKKMNTFSKLPNDIWDIVYMYMKRRDDIIRFNKGVYASHVSIYNKRIEINDFNYSTHRYTCIYKLTSQYDRGIKDTFNYNYFLRLQLKI